MIRRLTSVALTVLVCQAYATSGKEKEDTGKYPDKVSQSNVESLISFVEILFNTVGSQKASLKEKNTVISQTYLKAFASTNSKIEDDLHEREVIINKDVQNYLRDLDIFFKDARFDFEVQEIESLENADGGNYLKVRATRKLLGTNFNNEKVENQLERFIEVNVDEASGEYKIASIYNVESNSRLTLKQWWKDLSFEWKVIFQRQLQSEIGSADVWQLMSIDELDISYNRYVQTLEPLNVLVNLKKLNISNTTVRDLSPLYGLSNLEELHLSNTTVKNLDMVRELPSLKILSFESTDVADIGPLLSLTQIRKIVCTDTRLSPEDIALLRKQLPDCEIVAESVTLSKWWKALDPSWQNIFRKNVTMLKLEPNAEELTQIGELTELDISGISGIADLAPIGMIRDLQVLNASQTSISSIEVLSKMSNLKKLDVSNTFISSMEPVMNLPNLNYLNVDYTNIEDGEALQFMCDHPGALVLFNSKTYVPVWLKISENWKTLLKDKIGYKSDAPPTLDKLYEIIRIRELNIGDRKELADLAGLEMLPALQKLNISKLMTVSDLKPITKLKYLEELDCSYNPIESIEPLKQLHRLKAVNLEYTKTHDLSPLEVLVNLRAVNVSGTRIKNLNALRISEKLEELHCNNTSISSLTPLITLQHLQELSCYNTKLAAKDVDNFKKSRPDCKVTFY